MFEFSAIDLAILVFVDLVVEIFEIVIPVLVLVDFFHVGNKVVELILS